MMRTAVWVMALLVIFTIVMAHDVPPIQYGLPFDGASEWADNTGKKAEESMWSSFLTSYSVFRQAAAGMLENVNGIMGIVEAGINQISAIQRLVYKFEDIAQRCSTLYANTENFFGDGWDKGDMIKNLNYLEENIMQQADGIVLGVGLEVPRLWRQNVEATRNIGRASVAWWDLSVSQYNNTVWTTEYAAGKFIDTADKKRSSKGMSYIVFMANKTADSAAVKQQAKIDTLQSRIAGQGVADVNVLADANFDIYRNMFVRSLQMHEPLGQRVTQYSELLMRKTETINEWVKDRDDRYNAYNDDEN